MTPNEQIQLLREVLEDVKKADMLCHCDLMYGFICDLHPLMQRIVEALKRTAPDKSL